MVLHVHTLPSASDACMVHGSHFCAYFCSVGDYCTSIALKGWLKKALFAFDIITTMDSNRYCNIFIDGTCRNWISRVLTYIVSTLECEIGLCLDRDISDELLFI